MRNASVTGVTDTDVTRGARAFTVIVADELNDPTRAVINAVPAPTPVTVAEVDDPLTEATDELLVVHDTDASVIGVPNLPVTARLSREVSPTSMAAVVGLRRMLAGVGDDGPEPPPQPRAAMVLAAMIVRRRTMKMSCTGAREGEIAKMGSTSSISQKKREFIPASGLVTRRH
jgi:hypothetical protein